MKRSTISSRAIVCSSNIAVLLAGLILFFSTSLAAAAIDRESDDSMAWKALQQGTAVAIMRHALAPGMGDPAEFTLGQCSTQRNLSDEGRSQAERIGAMLRANKINPHQILSSEWCRCQETAELLKLGNVTPAPMLNSFFQNRSTAEQQTAELRNSVENWIMQSNGPVMLVTHQVNISALTGEFARSGEILIITIDGDELKVMLRLSDS